MGGLGLCLFILFFGVLVGDVALSNDDMELFPQIVILLMAAVCIGISIRLLLKKGFAWDRIGDEAYQEKRSSINRWVYEYFHPFKIRYEDAPEDSTELEKKLTGIAIHGNKFLPAHPAAPEKTAGTHGTSYGSSPDAKMLYKRNPGERRTVL